MANDNHNYRLKKPNTVGALHHNNPTIYVESANKAKEWIKQI